MAHQYDNFVDAYTDLRAAYSDANTDWDYASDHWLAWQVHFNAGQYNSAQYDLARCVQRMMWAMTNIFSFTGYGAYYSLLCENIYWGHYDIETGELDMASILSTMLTATPPQVTNFVGLVDAYRQSIWNNPFNREYYAALARGFTLWE